MSEVLLSKADSLDDVGKLLEAARVSANEEQLKINAEKILEGL